MDGLSVASGVVGLVSLTIELIKTTYKFARNIKNASKDIQSCVQALSSLQVVLLDIDTAVRDSKVTITLPLSINDCKNQLDRLRSELETPHRMQSLKWPFRKSETREMVSVIQRYRDDLNAALSAKIMTVAAASLAELAAIKDSRNKSDLLDWLYPEDHTSAHRRHLQAAEPGTGTWLFENPYCLGWIAQQNRLLLLQGKPGSGKSILISQLIDHIQQTSGKPVIYYHFSHTEHIEPDTVLRCLVKQAVNYGMPASAIQNIHDSCRQPLRSDLLSWLAGFSGFAILDALDEAPLPQEAAKMIRNLVTRGVSVCVSSRDIPVLDSKLPSSRYLIKVAAQNDDMRLFLESRFNDIDIDLDDDSKRDFVATIIDKADGIFLAARLIMNGIQTAVSIRDVRDLLSSTLDLANLYEATYRRIQQSRRGTIAQLALQWVAQCKRTLTVEELRHALAIEVDSSDMDPEKLTSIDIIVSCTMGLLKVSKDRVSLLHPTAYDFFRTSLPEADLGRICMSYLQYQEFSHPCTTFQMLELRLKKYPLLDYSARYWFEHLKTEPPIPSTMAILQHEGRLRTAVQAFFYIARGDYHTRTSSFNNIPVCTPVNIACATNLPLALEHLLVLDRKTGATQPDSEGWCPIHHASSYGHPKVLKKLLEVPDVKEQTLNLPDKHGQTPLFWSSIKGHASATSVLVDAGADILHRDKGGWNVLQWVSFKGDQVILDILLRSKQAANVGILFVHDAQDREHVNLPWDNSAPINCSNPTSPKQLSVFTMGRRDERWRRYRRVSAAYKMWSTTRGSVGPRSHLDTEELATPMFATRLFVQAVLVGHVEMVKLLLESGWLDGPLKSNLCRRCVVLVAAAGHDPEVCNLLLRFRTRPIADDNGKSRLHLAPWDGSLEIIEAVLPFSGGDAKALCQVWHKGLPCSSETGE